MSAYESLPDTMTPGKTPKTSGTDVPHGVPCFVFCGIPLGSGNPTEDPFGGSANETNPPCCVCFGSVIMTDHESRTCAKEGGSCLNCCATCVVIANGCYEVFSCLGQCLACLG